MMHGWVLGGTAFLASAVECVEAATIVLAVGYAQGWRAALTGAALAGGALAVIIALFGPLLANASALAEDPTGRRTVPRRSSDSSGCAKPCCGMPDACECATSAPSSNAKSRVCTTAKRAPVWRSHFKASSSKVSRSPSSWSRSARRASRALSWSAAGAAAAFAAVTAAAIVLHKPFARVPENAMKALVGVMLASVGTFWFGEGVGRRVVRGATRRCLRSPRHTRRWRRSPCWCCGVRRRRGSAR